MMIKHNKNSSKSKAISSYILSGINIKRMIQDEFNSECNVSDLNIIRVNRRPIFKIKEREKENNQSIMSSLPNKSFKIRSYTKKMKDGKVEEDSCEIFEKVEKMRNFRAISNRIEVFNLSKQHRVEREENQYKIQTKIKQILQRESSIKCKVSNQVFVKQVVHQAVKRNNNSSFHFQQFDSEKYRQISHKVHAYFNPQLQGLADRGVLLIVSLEAIHIHAKRIQKNSSSDESHKLQKQIFMNQEQIELLKMLSSKYYPNDHIWPQVKIAFKVNNSQQLQELRMVLQNSQMNDYFCIFYPIKKYVECWNLYQIDCFLEHTTSIIMLETKWKVKEQFPIVNFSMKTMFVLTNNDNYLILTRTISAIKSFIAENIKQSTLQDQNLLMISEIALNEQESLEQQRQSSSKIEDRIANVSTIIQYGLKEQILQINTVELNAKLEFTLNSRQLKNCNNRNHNRSTCTQKQTKIKRRTLCERENNLPMTASKNRNAYISSASACIQDKWDVETRKQDNLQNLKEKLLLYMKNERCGELLTSSKNTRKVQYSEKTDELDEITNYVRGSNCKSKTNHQIISELIKKNANIYRQIQEYLQQISVLNTQYKDAINFSVSVFNIKQYTKQDLPQDSSQVQNDRTDPKLQIKAFRVF